MPNRHWAWNFQKAIDNCFMRHNVFRWIMKDIISIHLLWFVFNVIHLKWQHFNYSIFFYYRPPLELREANVFSRVWLLFCLSTGWPPCDDCSWCLGPQSTGPPGRPPPGHQTWGPTLETCSNCSLEDTPGVTSGVGDWSPCGLQAGSTHPTGMFSYYFFNLNTTFCS